MKNIMQKKLEIANKNLEEFEDLIFNSEDAEKIENWEYLISINDKLIEDLEDDLERLEDIEQSSSSINKDYSIAIEDWALYNEGWLACKWWDYDSDIDDIEDFYKLARKYVIEECFDEVELFIADADTPINSEFSEYTSISEALDKLNILHDSNDEDLYKISFLMDNGLVDDLEEASSRLEDVVIWSNMDMEDVAREYVDNCYNLDEFAYRYFDFKSLGEDMLIDGRYFEVDGDIYEYMN